MDVGSATTAFEASSTATHSGLQYVPAGKGTQAPGAGTVSPHTRPMASWPTLSGLFPASYTAPRYMGSNACASPRSALCLAARNGDAIAVRRMLAAGSGDVGMVDPTTGDSPLMLAARHGHEDVVSLLCESISANDLHRQDAQGNTALTVAGAEGHVAVVMLLVNAGANPAHRTYAGKTVADLLMAQGSFLAAAALANMAASAASAAFSALQGKLSQFIAATATTTVTTSAPVDTMTHATTTIARTLSTAPSLFIGSGNIAATNYFKDDACARTVQDEGSQPGASATLHSGNVQTGDPDCVPRELMARVGRELPVTAPPGSGALSPHDGSAGKTSCHDAKPQPLTQSVATGLPGSSTLAATPTLPLAFTIFEAVECHDAHALKRLLAETRKSGKNSRKALRHMGEPQVPENSPLKKANVTALMLAAALGYKDLLDPLVDAGAKIDRRDSQGRTALMWAVAGGQTAAAQALLEVGAKVDRANAEGKTALMLAACLGHTLIAQALLQEDANPNQTDSAGKSALMYAALHGHTTIVQSLLHYGAEINQLDADGTSALIYAARHDHAAAVQIMLDHGAWIDHANASGVTALINAVQKGHATTVRTLLLNRADVRPETRGGGDTAMRIAIRLGNDECKRLLLSTNADTGPRAGSNRHHYFG